MITMSTSGRHVGAGSEGYEQNQFYHLLNYIILSYLALMSPDLFPVLKTLVDTGSLAQ